MNNEIEITTYDRLLRSWEKSMELVRDFEMSSKVVDDGEIKDTFKKYAEEQGKQASKFRELLIKTKNKQ